MAAVLCKGCLEICALPFKCCGAACRGFGQCFSQSCKCMSECCKPLAPLFAGFCSNPFCSLMTLALCVQLPAILVLIPEISGIPGCNGSLWLTGNAVLALINILAAFYLAFKVVDISDPNMAHLDTSLKRITYLLCHDVFMAIYICIFIGFFVLQGIGATLMFQDLETDPDCNSSVEGNVRIGNMLGWAYIFAGFFCLMFSMCCATFDHARYYHNNQNNNTTNNNNVENPPQPPHNPQGVPSNDFPAGYNAQGVPSNDFPASNTTYNAQGVPTNDYPASNATAYNAQGIPSNDFPQKGGAPAQEPEIPFAQAEEIPHHHASAPPAEYDTSSGSRAEAGQQQHGGAEQRPTRSSTGGNVGSKAGKQIGKFVSSDPKKQQKIEDGGKKAGETVEKGFVAAKHFVNSKMSKKK